MALQPDKNVYKIISEKMNNNPEALNLHNSKCSALCSPKAKYQTPRSVEPWNLDFGYWCLEFDT